MHSQTFISAGTSTLFFLLTTNETCSPHSSLQAAPKIVSIAPNLAKRQMLLLSPLHSTDSVFLHAQHKLLIANFCALRVPYYLFWAATFLPLLISVWSHLLPLLIACNFFHLGQPFCAGFAQPLVGSRSQELTPIHLINIMPHFYQILV